MDGPYRWTLLFVPSNYAHEWMGDAPTYTAQGKGPHRVKIRFSTSENGVSYSDWIGRTGFADADVLVIPRQAEYTLNVTLLIPPA